MISRPTIRTFSVKVLALRFCFCFSAGSIYDPISVIRRRVDCIKFERLTSRIDDVVFRSGRDDKSKPRFDHRAMTVKHRFSCALLDSKELIERVNFVAEPLHPEMYEKADVAKHPQAFHHVGLLIHKPAGEANLLFDMSSGIYRTRSAPQI